MKREELPELHYITPIDNVPSILNSGILSHRLATQIIHRSVAMAEIQDRRAKVVVPNGMPLHEYANLYICGRNPMLYKRKNEHAELCVIRVGTDVLDIPGAVVTDSNASSPYVRFAAAPNGLSYVNQELTFAVRWTDPDPIQYWRQKSRKCAEVLIPNKVDSSFILGAYVSNDESRDLLISLAPGFPLEVNRSIFFLG
jgi:hypothetical protein